MITEFSVVHNVHTILVHHLRKEETDFLTTNMSKLSLKGSSSLGDMVDSIFILWRNRSKEQKLKDPKFLELDEEEQSKLRRSLDTLLRCEKARDFDEEPRLALWFDRASHLWVERQGAKPTTYVKAHL
jgi:twinkle protein